MRILRTVLALGLLGLALAGCAADVTPSPAPTPTTAAPTATGPEAIALVGMWRVSGVADETPDTWLRLDAGEASLWRDCGVVDFSWAAQKGQFIAGPAGWNGCDSNGPPVVEWLDAVTGYAEDGDGWSLLNRQGEVLATLTVDGGPQPHPNRVASAAEPPEITASTRYALRDPVPLPASLVPGDIVGRWVPEGFSGDTDPFVKFGSGEWTSSDGCNGQGGRWVSDPGGLFLSTSGLSTLIGCDNFDVASWVVHARSVGFDGDSLVLVNANGAELGRLVRG